MSALSLRQKFARCAGRAALTFTDVHARRAAGSVVMANSLLSVADAATALLILRQ